MAMDAINEIITAEKAGDEAIEIARNDANLIIDKSKNDGESIIEKRKKEGVEQANKIIDNATQNAKRIENDGLEKNRQAIEVLKSIIDKRLNTVSEEVAKLILN